jgi:hypothetical protein
MCVWHLRVVEAQLASLPGLVQVVDHREVAARVCVRVRVRLAGRGGVRVQVLGVAGSCSRLADRQTDMA